MLNPRHALNVKNAIQVDIGNTNKKLNLNNISRQEGKDIATLRKISLLLLEKCSSSLVRIGERNKTVSIVHRLTGSELIKYGKQ